MYEIQIDHTIDAGHRIVGHLGPDGMTVGKCARLHGHTYGFTVTIVGDILDGGGMVVDFATVKGMLDEWDHRLVLWDMDPWSIHAPAFRPDPSSERGAVVDEISGIVRVPFNPTAENMAQHLATRIVGELDQLLLARVEVRETDKTRATYSASRVPRRVEAE